MTEDRKSTVNALAVALDRAEGSFASLLPATIPAQRFVRVIKDALNRNAELQQCTPASLVDACSKAAQDGLVLDGREAALVIFNKREKQGGRWVTVAREAQYIPMVAGLRRRVFNSGEVSALETGIVYDAEIKEGRFKWQSGTDAVLIHEPLLFGELGAPVAAYSVVTMANGTKSVEVMRWSEIMAIAKRQRKNVDSDGDLQGIWKTDLTEMARKTVFRRHSKQLPFSADTARVFSRIDDMYQGDEPDADTFDAETGEITEPRRSKERGGAARRMREDRQRQAEPQRGDDVEDLDPIDQTDQYEDDTI